MRLIHRLRLTDSAGKIPGLHFFRRETLLCRRQNNEQYSVAAGFYEQLSKRETNKGHAVTLDDAVMIIKEA